MWKDLCQPPNKQALGAMNIIYTQVEAVAPRPRQAEEREGVVPDGFSDILFGPVLKFVLFSKAAGDEMQRDHDCIRHVRGDSEAF